MARHILTTITSFGLIAALVISPSAATAEPASDAPSDSVSTMETPAEEAVGAELSPEASPDPSVAPEPPTEPEAGDDVSKDGEGTPTETPEAATDSPTSSPEPTPAKKESRSTVAPQDVPPTILAALSSSKPTISGTVEVGKKVTATPGDWTKDAKLTYQWLRDDKAISDATKSSYTLVKADSGKKITVAVTGTLESFEDAVEISQALQWKLKSATPKVSGTPGIGKKLTAEPGTWTKDTEFTYQWLRDGKKISKATKSSYTPVTADAGKQITVTVTGKKTNYAKDSATSSKTRPIMPSAIVKVWEKNKKKLGSIKADLKCRTSPKGCLQKFDGGTIYDVPGKGAHIVYLGDPITAQWKKHGWETGKLGYPIGNKKCMSSPKGCLQKFQKGTIYDVPKHGTFTVMLGKRVTSAWGSTGWEKGTLGYPVSNELCHKKTCAQSFQGGAILSINGAKASVYRGSTKSSPSITAFVNKKNPISPKRYAPPTVALSRLGVGGNSQSMHPEAAVAMASMTSAARSSGITLNVLSGYRSYDTQSYLFNNYVRSHGRSAAETFSARPGYSEHQLGLAADMSSPNSGGDLSASFGSSKAGKWVAANGWKYGFIVRYTAGKQRVTGYIYEPWHIRYVGAELAAKMHSSKHTTYEEYLGKPAAPTY